MDRGDFIFLTVGIAVSGAIGFLIIAASSYFCCVCHKTCNKKKPIELYWVSQINCVDDLILLDFIFYMFFSIILFGIMGCFMMILWNFALECNLIDPPVSKAALCDYKNKDHLYLMEWLSTTILSNHGMFHLNEEPEPEPEPDPFTGDMASFFDLLGGADLVDKADAPTMFMAVFLEFWMVIDIVLYIVYVGYKDGENSFEAIFGTVCYQIVLSIIGILGIVYSQSNKIGGPVLLLVWPISNALRLADSILNLFMRSQERLEKYKSQYPTCFKLSGICGTGTGLEVDALWEAIIACSVEAIDFVFSMVGEVYNFSGDDAVFSAGGLSFLSILKIISVAVTVTFYIKKYSYACCEWGSLIIGALYGAITFTQLLIMQLRMMHAIPPWVSYTHLQQPLLIGVPVLTVLLLPFVACGKSREDSHFFDEGDTWRKNEKKGYEQTLPD